MQYYAKSILVWILLVICHLFIESQIKHIKEQSNVEQQRMKIIWRICWEELHWNVLKIDYIHR